MADMRVGWVPPLDCQFFLARYHTGVVGDFHGHFEASQCRVFLLVLLKYPLFGLLEDSRLIVTEKAVVATFYWKFNDTPFSTYILSSHMWRPPQLILKTKNGDERGLNSDNLWDYG